MDLSTDPRFVSRLTRRTLAVIMAGGRGSRLHELTAWRAKPGVAFGGKFRIIDFPLSNCVNSGVRRICVLTQYKAHSLIRHLMNGWGHFQPTLGEFVEILPASQRMHEHWYVGTADAVYQNLDIIRTHAPEFVLVLSGDHVYKMDYGSMLAYHVERGADLTVSCLEVPLEEARGFGVMSVASDGRVLAFDEKPREPAPVPGKPGVAMASMGNYVFNTQFLFDCLIADADDPDSEHDFARDLIPSILGRCKVYGYPFRDPATGEQAFWRDVGTLDAFWEANIELVSVSPELNLYDEDWPILTDQAQLPPAKFVFDIDERRGQALNSMVSGGCVISGALVRGSLLFSNVKVHSHVVLEESVVLPDVDVGRGARIRRAIIDRGCHIPQGMRIGHDPVEDARRFRVTDKGIVLVTPEMLGQQVHFARSARLP